MARIRHIALHTEDPAKTAEFYKDVFGMREIAKLEEAFDQKSLTIVPIHLYFSRGLAKLEIGVGRGRRNYDRRDKLSAREAARQMREAVRQ